MGQQALTTKAALLQELLQGDGCGGKLKTRVQRRTGVELLHGALFPALRRLEKDGLTEAWEEGGKPGKDRVWYRLTVTGRKMAWEHRAVMQKFIRAEDKR